MIYTTIVTHGDLDGICSAAAVVLKYNLTNYITVFTQPFQVLSNDVKRALLDEMFVCDLAINNRNPEMTLRFLSLNERRLIRWYDHHEGWKTCKDELVKKLIKEKRLVVKTSAKTATEMITKNKDLIKIARCGDTGQYEKHEFANLINAALKVNLHDNTTRCLALDFLLDKNKDFAQLYETAKHYEQIKQNTLDLFETGRVTDNVFFVDASKMQGSIDRTFLCFKAYEKAPFVVMKNRSIATDYSTFVSTNTDVNLKELFNLKSGSSFRISVSQDKVADVITKLKELQDNNNVESTNS